MTDNSAGFEGISRQVLVQDREGNYRNARLRLSLSVDEIGVSLRGYLHFEVGLRRESCIAFNELTGELLGGSELIDPRLGYNI